MALGLLIGFLVIIIVGLPVGFAMGVISIVSIGILDGSMLIIPQKLFSSINNFTYLCIPLYVLAAEIMSVGGLTEKIVHFCDCLVGHIHGGLSHVNVLGSMFFAGISGSATADVSGLGRLEIDMQEKAGYPRDYAASVTAASSTESSTGCARVMAAVLASRSTWALSTPSTAASAFSTRAEQ